MWKIHKEGQEGTSHVRAVRVAQWLFGHLIQLAPREAAPKKPKSVCLGLNPTLSQLLCDLGQVKFLSEASKYLLINDCKDYKLNSAL